VCHRSRSPSRPFALYGRGLALIAAVITAAIPGAQVRVLAGNGTVAHRSMREVVGDALRDRLK
jgi:hypothetical protein